MVGDPESLVALVARDTKAAMSLCGAAVAKGRYVCEKLECDTRVTD